MARVPYCQRSSSDFSQPTWSHIPQRRHQSAPSLSLCSASRTWAADSWHGSDNFCNTCPQGPGKQKWWWYTSPGSADKQETHKVMTKIPWGDSKILRKKSLNVKRFDYTLDLTILKKRSIRERCEKHQLYLLKMMVVEYGAACACTVNQFLTRSASVFPGYGQMGPVQIFGCHIESKSQNRMSRSLLSFGKAHVSVQSW